MKAKYILALVILCFLALNIFSQSKENGNHIKNTYVRESINESESLRTVSTYTKDNVPLEKIIYKRLQSQEWQILQKYQYVYDDDNKLESVCYNKWNHKIKSWEPEQKIYYLPKGKYK